MGPPGGGRNHVTNRYLRHYSLVCATAFSDHAMTKIFGALCEWWVRKQEIPLPVARHQTSLVAATIDLYRTVQRELLPTPTKSHYTFNLRDVSKVFQMITSATATSVGEPAQLTRLWVHESLRVFHDRLTDDADRGWFFETVKKLMEVRFFHPPHSASLITHTRLILSFLSLKETLPQRQVRHLVRAPGRRRKRFRGPTGAA
jgi:dynein heavy chain|tara:strand:- start:5092 stop:5697 length:606 start_codon:yes stop_codon:yes gene_type:complete